MPLKYNPKPRTETLRIAVFNPEDHGVAEFETVPGLTLDQREQTAQDIVNQIPAGYYAHIFAGIYTVGKTTSKNRTIQWG